MRHAALGAVLSVLLAAPAAAQLPAIGAPRGIVRFEIGGDFANTNNQFWDGASQPWRSQFSASAIGPSFYPELASTQSLVAGLSGMGNYALSIGGATMTTQASVGTLLLGATVGVTPKLSLFGTVPIVRQGVKLTYAFDSTNANAGYNPADPVFGTAEGAAETLAFLAGFAEALDTLGARIASGYYDGNPTDLALATATLASGTAYLAGLDSLFVIPGSATSFVPLAGSSAGQAMSDSVTTTQTTLAALGIPSFTLPLPLPAGALTASDYNNYLSSFGGPIAAAPFTDYASWLLGDIELGASYTLIDRWNRPDQPGGLRVVAQGLIRLPTGSQPLSNDFVALPTGGGQTDLQGAVIADFGGGRVGVRAAMTYNYQMSATVSERVTIPSQPIPWRNRLANLSKSPGNEFGLSATPYFQLAPGLALVGIVRYWSRAADEVFYASAADSIPGVSASDLAVGTDRTAAVVGGGISYAPPQTGGRVPLDAFWVYEGVISASGGAVPKASTIRMGFRVPVRMWGATPD